METDIVVNSVNSAFHLRVAMLSEVVGVVVKVCSWWENAAEIVARAFQKVASFSKGLRGSSFSSPVTFSNHVAVPAPGLCSRFCPSLVRMPFGEVVRVAIWEWVGVGHVTS